MNPKRICLFLLMSCLLGACSSAPPQGPELAVQKFYSLLNDGDLRAAKRLYGAEAQAVLDDPNFASDSAFSDWAKLETKNGKVDRVKIVNQQTDDDSATLDCEVLYTDGTSKARTMTLTLEDGQWKLGLLG